ncbi:MAG: META domain-containing protein [Candidatus Eisenbacteria bacterium]
MIRLLSPAVALALALAAAGCSKPPGETTPAPDSSAGVLEPPPQLAAIDAALLSGTWQWVGTNRPAERVAPADPARYTIAFRADSTAAVHADCNRGSGRFTLIEGQRIEIGPIATTRMACPEGSLDGEYLKELGAVAAYQVSGDTLSITLELEGGTMRFVRKAGS